MNIIGKYLLRLLEWWMILLILFFFAVRTPQFQTYLGSVATEFLSKKLNHKISIGKIDVPYYNRLTLRDVYAEGEDNDTLLNVQLVKAEMNFLSLELRIINLKNIVLNDGKVYLSRDKEDGHFNFQYLIDYFKPKKKSKRPFQFKVQDIGLANVHFRLNDNRKKKKAFGVDYAHLDADQVYVSLHDIAMKGNDIHAQIKHISLREQSGFVLSKMTADFRLSNQGMFFDNLRIISPNTSAFLPKLYFNMDGLVRFKTFVDDVSFDAQLAYSEVSMKDVSYFAPALKGMDEQVRLEAKVTQRIKDLSIQNLKLDIREKTKINGDFSLPDFRNLANEQIKQHIQYALVDVDELMDLKLPLGKGEAAKLNLNEYVQRFGFAEIRNLWTYGTTSHFRVKSNEINTAIGNVQIPNWISLTKGKESGVDFSVQDEDKRIFVNDFNLGGLLASNQFGKSSGGIQLQGNYSLDKGIFLDSIYGTISEFSFKGYNYHHITIDNGSYFNKVVHGKIVSKDENADLSFNGTLDFSQKKSYVAQVDLHHVELNRLNLIKSDSIFILDGILTTNIQAEDEFTYRGQAELESFCLTYGQKEFHTENATLNLIDEGDVNLILLQSDILDADIRGKIRLKNALHDMLDIVSIALPLLKEEEDHHQFDKNEFDYSINLKNINPILSLFAPALYVSNGTKVFGRFSSEKEKIDLTIQSPLLSFGKLKTKNINFTNTFSDKGVALRYTMSEFYLNDSLSPFESFLFVSQGTTDNLTSYVRWGKPEIDLSNIRWKTQFRDWDDVTFNIEKSLFTLDSHAWKLPRETEVTYTKGDWLVNDFELTHEDQFVTINGEYSKKRNRIMDICVSNIELEEVTSIFSLNIDAQGIGNGEFHLSNESGEFQLFGTSSIEGLVLNKAEVGDINVLGNWDNTKKAISVVGDLTYKNFKTFNIYGDYYTQRKKDNLDFVLDFDNTKIDFLNAFMNPDIVSNIKGYLTGKATVKGELSNPIVVGSVNLDKGNAKVAMFGVNYGFQGKVSIDNDLIYFDNLPLLDELGSRGMLTGTILHDRFKDFNFDIFIGLDDVISKSGEKNASFLAMNTKYKEGTPYYGKAFVNGWVGLSGYLDDMNIEVNLKTRKNTSIVIPLYGAEEIDDILSYHIKQNDSLINQAVKEEKIKGVRLSLNFDITPEALLKLVFDEQTEEEIAGIGSGKISINLSNEMPLSMEGNYIIDEGYYNFVYSPIRKRFLVDQGSSVSWNGGGPTDTDLNIKAVYKVNTDVSTISPELESKVSTSSTQNVDAIIRVNGNLDAPQLAFQLNAPTASESVKSALDRINSDTDELNRQFFMLLLTGHFQGDGISGIGNGGANAALEALSGQINNLLDAVSKDVRLNVDLRSDDLSGKNSQAIGFKTNLLDNKLIIKGNFGIENNVGTSEERNTTFIGDLSVEYLISKSGNFRVKVFNESNSYSAIQDMALGMFTQGVGLVYSESFNKFKETNFANFIADIFRKNKYFQYTKRRRKKMLPPEQ